MMNDMYHVAPTPGSTRQSPANVIVPDLSLKGVAQSIPTIRFGHNPAIITPPPPSSAYPLQRDVQSVVEVFYEATPLNNITSVAGPIKDGAKGRPLLPVGLKDRAASTLPPGMRQRAAAWTRNVSRWRAKRAMMPVARE